MYYCIRTTVYVLPDLTLKFLLSVHRVYFVWISEQTMIIYLYNINLLVTVTEIESVYCAVRPPS